VALTAPTGLTRTLTFVRTTRYGLLGLALVVGAGSGLGAIAFRWLIERMTLLFTGSTDYAGLGRVAHPHLSALGPYFVVLTPAVAGLLYGPLVYRFAREARGHGVPEVMFAVARRGGRIQPRVALVKAFASALCIGGGGSVGREGPIVQIGSALGSTVGSFVKVNESRLRMLVACGAAGGIAATFNAPLAGVFFAMELILLDFAAEAFGMVVIAAVTASIISRAALGNDSFLTLPTFTVDHVQQYVLFAVLGLVAGLVGVVFTRVLYAIEDACDWAWRGPEWLRPAVGGLLLGCLLLALPQMYGVGYPVLSDGVAGAYSIGFLLVLLIGKIVASSLTIGIGGSGGVFAPSLFIGAMLGSAFGQTVEHVVPAIAGPTGIYALIGMGAVFAGAARAPITAVVILFELTGEYSIILPLMLAIALATGVSHVLSRETIYTFKLSRRGVDLTADPVADTLIGLTVADVVTDIGHPLLDSISVLEASRTWPEDGTAQRALVDSAGTYRGVISIRALVEARSDGEHDDAPLSRFCDNPEPVTLDDRLADALAALDTTDRPLPVVDGDRAVVGWLSHRAVLGAMRTSS
jgi:CIC family chloride channel protein